MLNEVLRGKDIENIIITLGRCDRKGAVIGQLRDKYSCVQKENKIYTWQLHGRDL